MRVGLTYDLRGEYLAAGYSDVDTAEFDQPETIDAIAEALSNLGLDIDRIGNARQLASRLTAGDHWDLVFNFCEGLHGFGRESLVPALLDAWQIPYVFSDPLACAVTLHKGVAKHVVRGHGLATPDFAVVESASDARHLKLRYPLFAKPVAEGTGKGISTASRALSPDELYQAFLAVLRTYGYVAIPEGKVIKIVSDRTPNRLSGTLAEHNLRGQNSEMVVTTIRVKNYQATELIKVII